MCIRDRAEPTIARALAARLGLPADDLDVRLRAAAVNAALRVLTDDLAWAAADGDVTAAALEHHRDRLAETLRGLTRAADDVGGARRDRPSPAGRPDP